MKRLFSVVLATSLFSLSCGIAEDRCSQRQLNDYNSLAQTCLSAYDSMASSNCVTQGDFFLSRYPNINCTANSNEAINPSTVQQNTGNVYGNPYGNPYTPQVGNAQFQITPQLIQSITAPYRNSIVR